jgi:hypothetical protein
MTKNNIKCIDCYWYKGEEVYEGDGCGYRLYTCTIFPQGIPDEILSGKIEHELFKDKLINKKGE